MKQNAIPTTWPKALLTSVFVLVVTVAGTPSACAGEPGPAAGASRRSDASTLLYGDGVHDDTPAIQALLDKRLSDVHLPPPAAHYLISKTLRIHSNQSLTLDRFTRVRLAAKSDCTMLANADPEKGNEDIAVIGGVWDMNNMEQPPNPLVTGKMGGGSRYDANVFDRLITMLFKNVKGLTIRSLTVKDPVINSITGGNISHFLLEDITINHVRGNPMNHSFDCINFSGHCHDGIFRNIRALSAFDDVISLMPLQWPCGRIVEEGTMEDILIDGVFFKTSTGIRLYSSGEKSAIRRIHITNVFGAAYQYAIGITNGGRGVFDDLLIENIYCSKIPWDPANGKATHALIPVLEISGGLRIGSLVFRNLCRDETLLPEAEMKVGRNTVIDSLSVEHARMQNRSPAPLSFLVNDGEIKTLTLRDVKLTSAKGGSVVMNRGTVGRYAGDDVSSEGAWPVPISLGAPLPAALGSVPRDRVIDCPVPYGNYFWTDAQVVADPDADSGMALDFPPGKLPLKAEARVYVLEYKGVEDSPETYSRVITSKETLRERTAIAIDAGISYAWERLGEYDIDPAKERFAIAFGLGDQEWTDSVQGGWTVDGGPGAVTGVRDARVTFTVKDQARLGWPLLLGKGRYAVWARLCRHTDGRGDARLRIARIVLERVDGK